MTLKDLAAQLVSRRATYTQQLEQKRLAVLAAEDALIRARRESDTIHGALQATERDLGDVEHVLREAGKVGTPPLPAPVKP